MRRDVRWYVFVLVLFIFHQITQAIGWNFWPADYYLDPFTAIPIMLGTPVLLFRIWNKEAKFYIGTILFFTAVLIWVFETEYVVQVKIHPDVWDIPFYLLGALYYGYTINPVPKILPQNDH